MRDQHRLLRVLRLGLDAQVRGLLPSGAWAEMKLLDDRVHHLQMEVMTVSEARPLRNARDLTVALPLIKRSAHLDFVIEKGTELGVSSWWIVATDKCADRRLVHNYEKRMTRWRHIIESAVLQCGRTSVPEVTGVMSWDRFIAASREIGFKVVADLMAQDMPRPRWDYGAGSGLFLVGPEGGWGIEELKILQDEGFSRLWLGPLTLRSETAVLAGAVILLLD